MSCPDPFSKKGTIKKYQCEDCIVGQRYWTGRCEFCFDPWKLGKNRCEMTDNKKFIDIYKALEPKVPNPDNEACPETQENV
jgi:predicted ATP-dependent serine protease